MEINESYVKQIIEQIIGENATSVSNAPVKAGHLKGVFDTMTEALEAVNKAYQEFKKYSVAQREEMIKNIRKLTLAEAEVMAKMGVEETKMGRVSDKIIKHLL